MPSLTLRTAPHRVSQFPTELLRLSDRLRTEAAEQMALAFPTTPKRIAVVPDVSPCGLSRSRHGDATNAVYRVGMYFVALKWIGAPRERAQRLVDWLQGIIDALWPVEREDVDELSRREEEADSRSDRAQLAFAYRAGGSLRELITHLRDREAVTRPFLAALVELERAEEREAQKAALRGKA